MTLTGEAGREGIVLSRSSLVKSRPCFQMDRMNYVGDCPAGTLAPVEAVSPGGEDTEQEGCAKGLALS